MKLAILQCDEVLEEFQPRFGNYPEMIARMFDDSEEVVSVESFDCRKSIYPDNLDAYDCYITTGSRASVYDDEPWIEQLVDFVRFLDREEKKLIGICFGHQIIAAATGCMVEKSDKGWGVGVSVNRINMVPGWMTQSQQELRIIVSHQDQVTTLPPNALVIAESDFCPFFVVQWNNHFLSIQGHPEWNRDYSRTLINARRKIIPPERVEEGIDSLSNKPDNNLFTRWILDFIKY
ncbi:MAG: glutamine amidotransferase-related protein [Desulforhopalus sp.]